MTSSPMITDRGTTTSEAHTYTYYEEEREHVHCEAVRSTLSGQSIGWMYGFCIHLLYQKANINARECLSFDKSPWSVQSKIA